MSKIKPTPGSVASPFAVMSPLQRPALEADKVLLKKLDTVNSQDDQKETSL